METNNRAWWRGAVIYQIYPRSFNDSNGDGIGDLRGIIQRLEYVAGLGAAGVWISPFFTSPMKDFGYDVADYLDVDPVFGTLADFDELVGEAHRLDLKVIIDQVYSHTSDQHAWFEESRSSRDNPKSNWYVWADPKPDGTPPSNWQSVFTGPAWTWDARREQYYLHNFLAAQPDLNLHNPQVQDALLKVATFWLDRGVDGFRLDAINHGMHDPELRDNPVAKPPFFGTAKPYSMQEPKYTMNHPDMPALLRRLRALTDAYGGIFTVAEVGSGDPLPAQKAYTANERHLNSAYGFEFLGMSELTAQNVKSVVERWGVEPGEGWPSWAFSNHDAPRVASRWRPDLALAHKTRLFALLQISLRGNMFLYQGEELGLPQAEVPFASIQDPEALNNWPQTCGRDGARTPFPWRHDEDLVGFSSAEPWLPIDARHKELAVDRQEANPESTLHFFRRAIAFRNQSISLQIGDLNFLDADGDILAFTRSDGEDVCLCIFNLGGHELTFSDPLIARVANPLSVNIDVAPGATAVTLPPFSGLVGEITGG